MSGETGAGSQAPVRGAAARLLGRFHVTGVFWYRLHRWGVQHLPERSKRFFLPGVVAFFWLTLREIRAAIASNLDVVLGRCGWWRRQKRIWRTFHEYAWCLSERYERLSGDDSVELSVDGLHHWHRIQARESGAILLTAHLGHWELGSLAAGLRSRKRIELVREPEATAEAQRFVAELLRRESSAQYRVHFAGARRAELGLELLARLRQGAIVAIQGDRPRRDGRVGIVQLFEHPFRLPIGPVVLARTAGVSITPVFVFREGRHRARVCFRDPISPADGEGGIAGRQACLERIGAELEWAIRQAPHQWFCFRGLWPD